MNKKIKKGKEGTNLSEEEGFGGPGARQFKVCLKMNMSDEKDKVYLEGGKRRQPLHYLTNTIRGA